MTRSFVSKEDLRVSCTYDLQPGIVVHRDIDIYWPQYRSTTQTNSSHLQSFLYKAQNVSKPRRVDNMEWVPESGRAVWYGRTPSFSAVICFSSPHRKLKEVGESCACTSAIPSMETMPHYIQGDHFFPLNSTSYVLLLFVCSTFCWAVAKIFSKKDTALLGVFSASF